MEEINHIKAYILGLLVGGGKVDENTFVIDLPFKKWGMDPQRMNVIATDILTKICQYFNNSYNFNVTYEIGNGKWLIMPIENTDILTLKNDLKYLGLPIGGFLLASTDLSIAKSKLTGINVSSFLSGIFDTRASLTLSHRRFTDDAPVVSVEIPGSTKNFKFVVQLCSWLTDLGSTTDQVLYNHPNQHAASDPDYKGWKKGFKIRFLVRSFLAQYSFALQAKSIDVTQIERSQRREEQIPCILRKIKSPSPVAVHEDQNSEDLPEEVRNKLFFHYLHFCAVLGCPHAPVEEIKKIVKNKNRYISFFPRLSKGLNDELFNKFLDIRNEYFPELEISINNTKVSAIITNEEFKDFKSILVGLAYLFSEQLNGKRHIGSMEEIIKNSLSNDIIIQAIGDNYDSPLLISNTINDRAFICSSIHNSLNQYLINKEVEVDNLEINLKHDR